MTKYAIPIMKKAGKGSIINLASISGVRPRPGSSAYATAKAAAIHFTKAAAMELAADEIRVNCINPVLTETPMAELFPQEVRKNFISSIPLGHLAKPEYIAYAALYLASDESSFITGTSIDVDGGSGV